MAPRRETPWTHPVLTQSADERAKRLQNRIADAITRFAGSMPFVYLHVVWFVLWIAFGVEPFPFGLLTMIVSLEAIFLSSFVMISQNRAEEKQNEELLEVSRQILELTTEIHRMSTANPATST